MQLFVRPPWGGRVLTVEASPRETLASLRARVSARLLQQRHPHHLPEHTAVPEEGADGRGDDAWTTRHHAEHLRLALGGRELTCDGDDGGGGDGGGTTLEELRVGRGATLEAVGRLRGGMPVVKGAPKRFADDGNEDSGAGGGGGGRGGAKKGERLTPPVTKQTDKRSAFTRFVAWLPTWWEKLNENNKSLYLFSERSRIRRAAWRLIKWKWFDRVVTCAILLNCVFLAMYDPLSPEGSSWNVMLDMAEIFFTVAFAVEFVAQVVARNFIIGPGAYMHNPWHVLDFVIVVTGLISLVLLAVGIEAGKLSVMRTLRAMKPLKTINGMPGMRVLVTTILDSAPLVMNVVMLLAWLFFIFGIVGVQQFSGTLRSRCFAPGGAVMIREETNLPCSARSSGAGAGRQCGAFETCLETGVNPNHGFTSFDNVAYASLTIVQALTRKGWTAVMEQVEAGTGAGTIVKVYFSALVLFGSFFAMSIITAVVIATFQKTSIIELKTGSSADGKAMRAFFKRLNRKPSYIRAKRFFTHKWRYQKPLRRLVTHEWFAQFITVRRVVLSLSLSPAHGARQSQRHERDGCNYNLKLHFLAFFIFPL